MNLQVKIICAWCKDTIQEAPEGAPVSHGICEPCVDRVLHAIPPTMVDQDKPFDYTVEPRD